jgi:phosphate transport system permease protein
MIDRAAEVETEPVPADFYPQGEEVNQQIGRRRRAGTVWRSLFLAATVAAIVILSILLLKILNDTMGLVAEESEMPERELLLNYGRAEATGAPNVVLASEDDAALAAGVAGDANGLGLVPWSAYLAEQDRLKLVAVDGQTPSAGAVDAGDYLLTRPLYVYVAATTFDDRPQVAAFLSYYLQHAAEATVQAGYFTADDQMAVQATALAAAIGLEQLPAVDPADYEGEIVISGSSTVSPITRIVADRFIADGFRGTITIDPLGTTAGFRAYCVEGDASIDIINAGRAVLPTEFAACRANQRRLTGLIVGQDALTVVVNPANPLNELTRLQLGQLFSNATTWADADPAQPAETIHRYVPTADSGTLDFFVETVFARASLADLDYTSLVDMYVSGVSHGRCRAVERQQRFFADSLVCEDAAVFAEVCASDAPAAACALGPRDEASLQQLIRADVVRPTVLASWSAIESILRREEIAAEAALQYPAAELRFKNWLTWDFITSPQSSYPEIAGIRTAILGSLWVVGIAMLFSIPLGVGAAIYLEEYADRKTRFNQIIQTNINNLAGVPSIIYGLLGLAVFVRFLEPITSGAVFGAVEAGAGANGRTILSAGLTLGLLGLPVIIISAQEAIRAVPGSLRQASYGLGATRWQTVRHHVLPNAIGGILTGIILSMSRMIGETAPLVVVGASTYITADPTGPFSKFTTLPSQIYQWTARPQDTFRIIAAATIVVLLILLMLLNATAIVLRNRYGRRLG